MINLMRSVVRDHQFHMSTKSTCCSIGHTSSLAIPTILLDYL